MGQDIGEDMGEDVGEKDIDEEASGKDVDGEIQENYEEEQDFDQKPVVSNQLPNN